MDALHWTTPHTLAVSTANKDHTLAIFYKKTTRAPPIMLHSVTHMLVCQDVGRVHDVPQVQQEGPVGCLHVKPALCIVTQPVLNHVHAVVW
jgi:hypothetical protein